MGLDIVLKYLFYFWCGTGFIITFIYAYWSYQRRLNGTFAIPKTKLENEQKWVAEERAKFSKMTIEEKLIDLLGEKDFEKEKKKYQKSSKAA